MSDADVPSPDVPLPPAALRWHQILTAQPGNSLARFSLAKALFDAGRFAEAQRHLETALQARPDWMVVQILLGKCHLALGDQAHAREAFVRARQLAIDQHHDGPLEEVEQLLGELEGES